MLKKSSFSEWPLTRQLIIALVFSMFVVAVFAGFLQYQTETQTMRALLERQNQKNFQLLHAAIVEPIISEDLPVLQSFIDLLSQQDYDLYSIEIYNASGVLLLDWQQSQLPKKPLMTFSDKIILEDQVFGELKVSWSVDHFFQLIERKILQTQIFLACVLLALIIIVIFLTLKLAITPIKRIHKKVDSYLYRQEIPLFKKGFRARELIQLDISTAILGKAFKGQLLIEQELRKTKLEIEELSLRNELILNSAGDGVYVVNSKSKAIYVNPAAAKMAGRTVEELTGQDLNLLIQQPVNAKASNLEEYPDNVLHEKISNRANGYLVYSSIMDGKSHHVSNELFWRKDGVPFPVDYVSTPIIENEHQTGVVVVFKDITERLIAEQQVKDSEALSQAMLASSLDAIITIDKEGLICEFNPLAEDLFMLAKGDVLGRKMVDLIVPPYLRDKHNKGFLHFLETGNSSIMRKRIEIVAIRKTGEEFPIELVITPITLRKQLFFTAFIRDITEQKSALTAMDEALVKAEKATQAKSQFLATMSHEIRTPLNAIIGLNDLLQGTELNSKQTGYLQIAEQSGFVLKEIIDNILDFSKIESGKLNLDLQETDLFALIDSVISIMSPKALEKKLELVAFVDFPIPEFAMLDSIRIKQVLLNLVSNAIKFTEEGYVEICLKTEKNIKGEQSILFSVDDTGIGIAKDLQPLLFDEFVQADSTTTREKGGSGLGLTIAKQLIELSGGKIGIDSQQGEGSRFWFSLPTENYSFQPNRVQLNCLIFDRGTKGEKGAQMLYQQLKPFVSEIKLLASGYDSQITEKYTLVFLDESQLPYFSSNEMKQFMVNKPENYLFVLVTSNAQEQKDWLKLFDARLLKPVLLKNIQPFLSGCLETMMGENKVTDAIDSSKNEMTISGEGIHILLVEDSPVNQMVIREMLEKVNFTVDIAENGLLATEKVNNHPYDLILMDLSMPIMGGIEATELIKGRFGKNQKTPIIALTANAFKDNEDECYQVGMSGFLAKPITMLSLYQEINKHLSDISLSGKVDSLVSSVKKEKVDDIVIDATVLDLLKEETSASVFPELIKVFLEQGEQRVSGIEKAIAENSFVLLESEIHALKSESATFGAFKLDELTKQINLLCKQGLETQAFIEAKKVKANWDSVVKQLPNFIVE